MGERLAKQGGISILYDDALDQPPSVDWFRPEWWLERGQVTDELGGRGQAIGVMTAEGPAVLRRFRRGGLIAKLSTDRFFGLRAEASRAFREYRVLALLKAQSLPVPEPLAASFEPAGPFYRAALLMRRIAGAQQLAVLAPTLERREWEQLNETLARFFSVGLCHPDLNARNVVRDGTGQWYLLDFDRACIRSGGIDQAGMRRRLARSLAKTARSGWEEDFFATVGARSDR